MTDKQWHWIGEFAQTLMFVAALYLVIRLTEGRSYHPTIPMPSTLRAALVALILVLAPTGKTWRYYWRLEKRRARRPPA